MPEFLLPLDSVESHQWFDGLPEIARGYVEAAFFTGVTVQIPDPDGETLCADGDRYHCEELTGAGPANLDPESRAAMEAEAVRFWIANAGTLAAVERDTGGAYDLAQAGRDLWFTRNGHGVGFWDRGLGDAGDRLADAARALGEVDLFAEPFDPEAGEPIPEAEADPEDPESWRVTLDFAPAALSDLERAALAALEAGADAEAVARAMAWRDGSESRDSIVAGALRAMTPAEAVPAPGPLPETGGAYGAPMGRRSGRLEPGEAVRAVRVSLDPDGYDSGGAYWGTRPPGVSLWRVTGAETGESVYVDGRTRAEAITGATGAETGAQGESD